MSRLTPRSRYSLAQFIEQKRVLERRHSRDLKSGDGFAALELKEIRREITQLEKDARMSMSGRFLSRS